MKIMGYGEAAWSLNLGVGEAELMNSYQGRVVSRAPRKGPSVINCKANMSMSYLSLWRWLPAQTWQKALDMAVTARDF